MLRGGFVRPKTHSWPAADDSPHARRRRKRSRHSRRMRNPQFYVSGKMLMGQWYTWSISHFSANRSGLRFDKIILLWAFRWLYTKQIMETLPAGYATFLQRKLQVYTEYALQATEPFDTDATHWNQPNVYRYHVACDGLPDGMSPLKISFR